jgi:hypothetical protein
VTQKCALCGLVWEPPEWYTKEMAEAEALKEKGIANAASRPDMVILCEPCYRFSQAVIKMEERRKHAARN